MPRRRDDDDDDDDDDDEKALWDALGRGTAAGRAVFNLYSGDSGGKEYGAFANDFNRLQMRVSDPATRRAPPEVEEAVKKENAIASAARTTHARVRRPTNFTGAPPLTDAEAVRASFEKSKARRPGVRPKALSDLENAARREEAPLPPAPSRRLIGEQGKLRFQRLREFNGRLPEEQPENVADARRAREESAKPKTTRETAETLFSQVALEIEEREVFLAEMRAAGIGARYETGDPRRDRRARADAAQAGRDHTRRGGEGGEGGTRVIVTVVLLVYTLVTVLRLRLRTRFSRTSRASPRRPRRLPWRTSARGSARASARKAARWSPAT
jgi:hypothetical protein